VNMGKNSALGKGPFVLEGDEYDTAFFDKKSKFLHYRPQIAVLTSVELDHLDIFTGLGPILDSFREFVALIPEDGVLLVCGRSPSALEAAAAARCRVERYGLATPSGPPLEWQAEVTGIQPGGRTLFDVRRNGEHFGSFNTGLPGSYNIE